MVHIVETGDDKEAKPHLADLQCVLDDYSKVLEAPQGLPPSRECDHHFPLINPQLSVNARSYRYPFHQKNEIERQIQEMLKEGIIQPSSSPFASPVVLVRKADGSWCLRVDYRGLNRNTVKDKFPIPLIIDDLLDELHGGLESSQNWICIRAITKSE